MRANAQSPAHRPVTLSTPRCARHRAGAEALAMNSVSRSARAHEQVTTGAHTASGNPACAGRAREPSMHLGQRQLCTTWHAQRPSSPKCGHYRPSCGCVAGEVAPTRARPSAAKGRACKHQVLNPAGASACAAHRGVIKPAMAAHGWPWSSKAPRQWAAVQTVMVLVGYRNMAPRLPVLRTSTRSQGSAAVVECS